MFVVQLSANFLGSLHFSHVIVGTIDWWPRHGLDQPPKPHKIKSHSTGYTDSGVTWIRI